LLAQWHTQPLSEGAYTLRLTVKNSQSEVKVKRRNIQVKAPTDIISPGTVTALATSKLRSNSITLIWTAPGDDGKVGTATTYEIRYSDVTPFNWDKATRISKPPIPQPAGAQEKFTVTGLSPSTTYYFALKAVDEAGNWSDTSNIVTGETTEKSACEPIEFALKLFRGINLISIPVDIEGWRMSDLAYHIGKDSLSMIIRYDHAQGKFTSYLPTFPDSAPANAFVQCGAGYIVVMKAEKEVVFEGNPCESEIAAPSLMPIILSSDEQNTAIFVITGNVRREETGRLLRSARNDIALNGVVVKIRNLRTGQTVEAVTGTLAGDGNYVATFAASSEEFMTRVADELEITAMDKDSRFMITPVTYTLTAHDISAHLLFVPLQLSLPKQSVLLPNYPNPFNPETWLPYQLAEDADVAISIYNIKGQIIRTLRPGHQSAGFYVRRDKAAYWDGQDNSGEKVSSGTYFVTLRVGSLVSTRKMVTLK
ncbi:MAG: fibronectin type III domain-containing protein, partial [Candidatus Poribacteria bacterium]